MWYIQKFEVTTTNLDRNFFYKSYLEMNEKDAENTLAELSCMVSMNEDYNIVNIETKAEELKVFLMFYYNQ